MIPTKKARFILVLLIAIVIGSTLVIDASSKSFVTAEIAIDGTISENEWDSAAHKVEWFMDADPENSDGYNYMYLDEDEENLYVALDLCSDQTNNESGEWVGLWLNTNMAEVSDPLYQPQYQWEAALNNGMEALVHDVEKNETMSFFHESYNSLHFYMPSVVAINGTIDGGLENTWSIDNAYVNVTAEYNGTHYLTRVDIPLDFSVFFPLFEELFLDHVRYLRLSYNFLHNTTLIEHYLSVSDPLGNLNDEIAEPLGNGTGVIDDDVIVFPENFTSRYEVILSLNGISDTPFHTSYDWLRIGLVVDSINYIADNSVLPYSTVQNYEIAWSFGPSENNATDHRQFEIMIPKTELEGYASDTDLGIIVGGYGTLISFPNTHNWVFANDTVTGIPVSNWTKYNYYSMPLKSAPDPTTGTTTPITTTTPPDGGDITPFIIIAGVSAGGLVVLLLVLYVKKRQ